MIIEGHVSNIKTRRHSLLPIFPSFVNHTMETTLLLLTNIPGKEILLLVFLFIRECHNYFFFHLHFHT